MFPEDENGNDAIQDIRGAQVRIRINHTKTEKSGWKFESTVEITGADNAEVFERMLTEYERMTDRIGRDECDVRNVSDQAERKVAA